QRDRRALSLPAHGRGCLQPGVCAERRAGSAADPGAVQGLQRKKLRRMPREPFRCARQPWRWSRPVKPLSRRSIVSLSWLKKKPLRIGLGARRIMVSGGKAIELQAGDDWRGAVNALPE